MVCELGVVSFVAAFFIMKNTGRKIVGVDNRGEDTIEVWTIEAVEVWTIEVRTVAWRIEVHRGFALTTHCAVLQNLQLQT